jgi:replicative DNA helicase
MSNASDISDKFTTGITKLDEITNGGLSRGEEGIIFGDAKSGKSIGLVHIGASCIRSYAGKVLHIILEGSLTQTETRYDARFSAFKYRDIKNGDMPVEVFERLEREYKSFSKHLVIREMMDEFDYTTENVEAEILELQAHGFVPDMLIVDYGDLLTPRTEKLKGDSYLGQAEIFKDIRVLAKKYNMAAWSATQATRPKGKEEDPNFVLTCSNMSDSYHKARICDLALSLNRTTLERKAGIMRLFVDKYRDDECRILIPLKQDFTKMLFSYTDPNHLI